MYIIKDLNDNDLKFETQILIFNPHIKVCTMVLTTWRIIIPPQLDYKYILHLNIVAFKWVFVRECQFRMRLKLVEIKTPDSDPQLMSSPECLRIHA